MRCTSVLRRRPPLCSGTAGARCGQRDKDGEERGSDGLVESITLFDPCLSRFSYCSLSRSLSLPLSIFTCQSVCLSFLSLSVPLALYHEVVAGSNGFEAAIVQPWTHVSP